ncbi:MAG: hypothetical protein BroJett003_22120 [Planctomycetota bacterium]|nr:MAG: hypothetical protein BroJett003_22120 [Planctomycetota bacterium]
MRTRFLTGSLVLVLAASAAWAQPLGTAFTYQGRLKDGGSPASGPHDLRFRLYDAAAGGSQVGPTLCLDDVSVTEGLFTVALDFGAQFAGQERFLEVDVRADTGLDCANPAGFVTLAPRQALTAAPNALFALNAGSLTLPFSGSANVGSGSVFSITNTAATGTAWGLYGQSNSPDGMGVRGLTPSTSGFAVGVWGESASTDGAGVVGRATAISGLTAGVWGASGSPSGIGVRALAFASSGPAWGVWAESTSTSGTGVSGLASATSGTTRGVWGESRSTSGTGVHGLATATSGTTYGVWGESRSPSGRGVYGLATATSGECAGGWFQSDSVNGIGVLGSANAASGVSYGGRFFSNSTSGLGVQGVAIASNGVTYGGWFQSESTTGTGARGWATASSGNTIGVWGQSTSSSGTGVFGWATAGGGSNYGGWFQSDSTNGKGVLGWATATSGTTVGVWGQSDSPDGWGVLGRAGATGGGADGVWGDTLSSGSSAFGVVGSEPNGSPGHAVYAVGSLAATGTKSFQMDHPLMPETHYLNHFCTEGPDPMNAYSGNVVTDARGYATVTLPDYFESINREFRYQLTVADGAGEDFVQVRVVRKIQNNQFTIRTSAPHVEVSWRVEAIRNDPWVRAYGYRVEQEKEGEIKGKYLSPELYGQPKERGIHYRPDIEHECAPRDLPVPAGEAAAVRERASSEHPSPVNVPEETGVEN